MCVCMFVYWFLRGNCTRPKVRTTCVYEAEFCSQGLQRNRCLLSLRLKPWPHHHCDMPAMCICALQATYWPVLYTHPHPLHNLPRRVFTLTAVLALWGSVTTGQLQTQIRTGFIFPLNTFQLKGDRRTKAETRRAVRWNLREVIVNQLTSGS